MAKRNTITKPETKDYDHFVKLLLLGDSGVGKSSLMMRFSDNQFFPNLMGTAGVDFKMKKIDLDGKVVKLQIWDTAGQERFHTITKAYYRGAMGIVLVYDVNDRKTFDNLDYWMDNIQKHGNETVEKILVGNKIDLPNRVVESAEGETLAQKHGVPYIETSAKSAARVDDAFIAIARAVMKRQITNPPTEGAEQRIQLGHDTHKKSKCC
eukprot:GILK01005935.1.p1 GENE.GILK01005935.1~~GILK01005935.1.p1  ORF type:complete len:228 (+),score=30.05 GILK01005935.1:59-685(+)